MARLRFNSSAQDDLFEIAAYIARRSGARAPGERFVARLDRKCQDLAASPFRMGRARPELRSNLRSVSYRGYVIFFRYEGDILEVINILEGHRDVEAFFGGDEA